MYMHEILHWANEYQRDIYIYIYFNFVRLCHQTIGWCLLPYYIPSIIQYAYGQCALEHSLKQGNLVLKEHAFYRLQSALHSFN